MNRFCLSKQLQGLNFSLIAEIIEDIFAAKNKATYFTRRNSVLVNLIAVIKKNSELLY